MVSTLDTISHFATKEMNSANLTPRHMTEGSLTSVDDGADLPGNDIMLICYIHNQDKSSPKKIGLNCLHPEDGYSMFPK